MEEDYRHNLSDRSVNQDDCLGVDDESCHEYDDINISADEAH